VRGVRRPRKNANPKRPQRKLQLPARYSHEYSVHGGHSYLIRSIPRPIWDRARKRAHAEQRALRVVLIRALEQYAAGNLTL
jgi:hypothetical protein